MTEEGHMLQIQRLKDFLIYGKANRCDGGRVTSTEEWQERMLLAAIDQRL